MEGGYEEPGAGGVESGGGEEYTDLTEGGITPGNEVFEEEENVE